MQKITLESILLVSSQRYSGLESPDRKRPYNASCVLWSFRMSDCGGEQISIEGVSTTVWPGNPMRRPLSRQIYVVYVITRNTDTQAVFIAQTTPGPFPSLIFQEKINLKYQNISEWTSHNIAYTSTITPDEEIKNAYRAFIRAIFFEPGEKPRRSISGINSLKIFIAQLETTLPAVTPLGRILLSNSPAPQQKIQEIIAERFELALATRIAKSYVDKNQFPPTTHLPAAIIGKVVMENFGLK